MKTLTFRYTVSMLLIFPIVTSCMKSSGKMKDSSIELMNEPQSEQNENVVCLAYLEKEQKQVTVNE